MTEAGSEQSLDRRSVPTSRRTLSAFFCFLLLAGPCAAQVGYDGKGSDGSLGGDMYYGGFPIDFIDEIKSEDFAEAARKDWDEMQKALDRGSKEDFEKTVDEIKKLDEASQSRWELRSHEWQEYREQHDEALKRFAVGKINDEDVDVIKRYKEITARKVRASEDMHNIYKLKKLAQHSWKEWTELWERKKAWEKEHPGRDMLARRGADGKPGGDAPAKTETKIETKAEPKTDKPAHAESKKKFTGGGKTREAKENTSNVDPATIEFGVGIAAALLGSRGHHGDEHSMRGAKGSSSSMKKTNMNSSKTGSGKSATAKSGSAPRSGSTGNGGGGTVMNTTVGTPTISFGRGF